ETLGGESWFRLGDRDLGLHVVRTQALREGAPLSTVTARFAAVLGVEATILPATDEKLRTWLDTTNGSFAFQEWFVARAHRDPGDAGAVSNAGVRPIVTHTLMRDAPARRRLAEAALDAIAFA